LTQTIKNVKIEDAIITDRYIVNDDIEENDNEEQNI